jgi:hypothetical protein
VYISTDQGTSWTTIDLPIYEAKREEWSQICFIKETGPNTLYAGGWTHGPGQGGYVWKSTDDGMQWDTTASRIRVNQVKATKVYDLIKNADGVLIAGFQSYPDSAVAISRDDGNTWEAAGTIDGAEETLCLMETRDGSLFAGTSPNGNIYGHQPFTSVTGRADPLREFLLYPNYPNPFNASTAISFEIPSRSRVFLDIYDILGKPVRHLLNEDRPAGTFAVLWYGVNDSGNPVDSGVYVCRLQYGELFQTKKLLLLK